jgi:flagellar motor switch protein FliG
MNEGQSGAARCAMLLYSLGLEQASAILERLDPREASLINEAARRLSDIDHDRLKIVLADFQESMSGRHLLPGESASFIQAALQRAGTSLPEGLPLPELGLCPAADAESLANLIKHEYPQTIAVVLAHIDPERGAQVLHKLPPEIQVEVTHRLAKLTNISSPILRQIETTLDSQLRLHSQGPSRKVEGVKLAADILKKVPKEESNSILEGLAKQEDSAFDAVKQNMFVFSDLVGMDDRGVRNLLKEIESQVLSKALKAAEPAIRNKIFKNMSERAATMLEEDIDSLPPMRLSEVEEAQKAIIEIATTLIQDGRAIIAGAAGGEVLV